MRKSGNLPEQTIINIDPKVFNDAYLPYLNKIYAREVYYGGGSAGKSVFISAKMMLQLTAIPNRNAIMLRKTNSSCRVSCFESIRQAMNQFHLDTAWDIVEHPNIRMTNRTNGNVILFLGMDDVQKLKSITFQNGVLTDIWYEEVSEEDDPRAIRQLEVRLRGGTQKKRLIVSYNPVSAQHFIKNMAEKEWKGKFADDMVYVKTTYKDNKFLSKEDIANLEYFRYVDPYMYQVYTLGEYGSSGQSVFDRNKIMNRLNALGDIHQQTPPTVGDFSYDRDDLGHIDVDSFDFFINTSGETTVYKDVEPRVPYLVSLDTAGEGSDYHAAHVINNITGEQVAVFHSAKNPDHAVFQAFGLCKYYNNALFVPEINFDSYHLSKFKELGYRNIYQRGTPVDNYSDGLEQKLGFRTHVGNRQAMLSECVEFVNQNVNLINDVETLNEMTNFTRQERKMKGIYWAAEAGCRDDLVMSYAIALQARQQCSCDLSKEMEGSLKGTWLPMQLKSALEAGRITHEQKKEYEKNHAGHARLGTGINRNAIKRRSRYDR